VAEYNHFYVEDNADRSTASTSWVSIGASIAGTSLQANTKYLLIARAFIACQSVTNLASVRVNTADDSTIATASEAVYQMARITSTDGDVYMFVRSFTTGSTPQDVDFQLKAAGTDVTIDQSTLFLLDLDDLGSANYFEDTHAPTGTELTTTSTTQYATIAGSDMGSEDWLLFGYSRVGMGSVGTSNIVDTGIVSYWGDVIASDNPAPNEAATSTSCIHMFGFVARWGNNTVTSDAGIKMSEPDLAYNHTDEGAYLIALNMGKFASVEIDQPSGGVTVSTEWIIASVGPYTPPVAGNHLILGMAQHWVTYSDAQALWIDEGSTQIRTGEDTRTQTQSDRHEQFITMGYRSISAEKTYNMPSTGSSVISRILMVWNLNRDAIIESEIRPVADTAATGWDSAPTASQDLWAQVDEETPSDTDYIYAMDPNP
jgi:hypothetical protein